MSQFYVGEVVALQSGGVEMTVTDVRPYGIVTTVWTDDFGQPHEIHLPSECLFDQQEV